MPSRGQKDNFSVPSDIFCLCRIQALLEVLEYWNRGNLGSKVPLWSKTNSSGKDPNVLPSITGGLVDKRVWLNPYINRGSHKEPSSRGLILVPNQGG